MKRWASLAMVVALFGALPTVASAGKGNDDKVTICHRTNSVTNPYVVITVAQSAVDGISGKGKHKADHFGTPSHQGPVFDPAIHTKSGMDWGDIIPPIPGVHDGANWDAAGQAIFFNGCAYAAPDVPDITDDPDEPGGDF